MERSQAPNDGRATPVTDTWTSQLSGPPNYLFAKPSLVMFAVSCNGPFYRMLPLVMVAFRIRTGKMEERCEQGKKGCHACK